jgi:hypothetical protein
MGAQVRAFLGTKQAYQELRDGVPGMPGRDVMAVMAEIGETMGVQALYELEERTTERPK